MVPDDDEYTFVLLFDTVSAARRNGAYSISRKSVRPGDVQEEVALLKKSRGPFEQASKHVLQVSVGKVLRLHKRSRCKRVDGFIERRSGWTARQCRSACMKNSECLGYHHADSKQRSRRQCFLLPFQPLVENANDVDVTPRNRRRRFNRFSCGVAQ